MEGRFYWETHRPSDVPPGGSGHRGRNKTANTHQYYLFVHRELHFGPLSSLSGSFDPAIALFEQSWAEFSEQSANDELRLTKSSLTALLGCKLRSVGLTSSLSFSLEHANAEIDENAFAQLAKCNTLVCQSEN